MVRVAEYQEVMPYEIPALRLKQKVFAGRYGRQPIDQWEGRPITELNGFCASLAKLLEEEAPDKGSHENSR